MTDITLEDFLKEVKNPRIWETRAENLTPEEVMILKHSDVPLLGIRYAHHLFLIGNNQAALEVLDRFDSALAFSVRLSIMVDHGEWQQAFQLGMEFIRQRGDPESLHDVEAYARILHQTGAAGIQLRDPRAVEVLQAANYNYQTLNMTSHGVLLERARGLCVAHHFEDARLEYQKVILTSTRKIPVRHALKDITLPLVSLGSHTPQFSEQGHQDLTRVTSDFLDAVFTPAGAEGPVPGFDLSSPLGDVEQYRCVACALRILEHSYRELQKGQVTEAQNRARKVLELLWDNKGESRIRPEEETPHVFSLFATGIAAIVMQLPSLALKALNLLRDFYLSDLPITVFLRGVLTLELFALQRIRFEHLSPAEALRGVKASLQASGAGFGSMAQGLLRRFATTTGVLLDLHQLAPWDARTSLKNYLVICEKTAYLGGQQVAYRAVAVNSIMFKALGLEDSHHPNEEIYRWRHRQRLSQLGHPPLTFAKVLEPLMGELDLLEPSQPWMDLEGLDPLGELDFLGPTERLYMAQFDLKPKRKRRTSSRKVGVTRNPKKAPSKPEASR